MSNILTQTIARAEPVEVAPVDKPSWRRWPKIILLLLVLLWIANAAISFAIQHTSLNRRITGRLASAFGRPVEVAGYNFSVWGRPTLEARSVIVGEDPRFGREYFLRTEALTMSIRWQSLLHGRLEFGAISLSHPSLNLVRSPDGDWNLAAWLPRLSGVPGAAALPASSASGPSTALRFSRVDVDAGRINFKRGDEKLPLAFVGVSGYVEPEGTGQWRMDLEAVPARAAVILQQAGTLHLSGHVGGTSSRLRPAVLDLAWTDASISDVLRLIRATDYGVRGNLALALNARTETADWMLQARAELRQVHRWDLPLRPDNPSLNLIVKGILDPEHARFDLADSTLETPRSNARSTGAVSWSQPIVNRRGIPHKDSRPELRIISSGIDMADILAWTRAFHSGISDDLALRGIAKLDLTLGGWPPHLDDGTISVDGADLTSKALPVPVRLNAASLHYGPNGASLLPSTISFGAAGGALHIETIGPIDATGSSATKSLSSSKPAPILRIAGTLADAGDLISAARLLGWDISRGWDLTGPFRCDLKWQASPYPWRAAPLGTLDFGAPLGSPGSELGGKSSNQVSAKSAGDSLRAPFLNLPVEQIRARVELKPNARHISLTSADAFGAHWSGAFDRHDPAYDYTGSGVTAREPAFGEVPSRVNPWKFALSADHLSAADLDRWLNPRWRESFLDRVLPFLNSRPLAVAQPERLAATGNLNVDQFTLAPFAVHRIQADAAIDGRRLTISNIRAQFYKGDLSGSLRADLGAAPSYRLNLDFSGVDLYALAAAAPSLADRFAGSASGRISIATRGASRADLISSLQCRGVARISGPELRNIDLTDSFARQEFRPGITAFREASTAFTCGEGKLAFQRLQLTGPEINLAAEGAIDFSRNLDFKLSVLSAPPAPGITSTSEAHPDAYRLTGNLAEPEITHLKSASPRP
ncbi:MAG: AsmA family protein [Candidatus Acidiferrales bacterium]